MSQKKEKGFLAGACWTVESLMQAAPGRWLTPPPEDWCATGV